MMKKVGRFVAFAAWAAVLGCTSGQALAQSKNVLIVPQRFFMNGGMLVDSGGDLDSFTISSLPIELVNAARLATFDTVVLNVGSFQINCTTASLSDALKADLVSFLKGGGKLIIYESECPASDYSWLPTPFTTYNPGAHGATGEAKIVENNALGSTNAGDPEFIDVEALSLETDAVGDANVMTTRDPDWCLHMTATNVDVVTGPTHTYARVGKGLLIYNGLDQDDGDDNPENTLTKLWTLELKVPFNPASYSDLPCRVPVVQRTSAPAVSSIALMSIASLLLLFGVRRVRRS